MYATILISIIVVAFLGRHIRHQQAVSRDLIRDLRLEKFNAENKQKTIISLLDEVEDLEWQLGASSHMLKTAMNELPKDHVFYIPNPKAEERKERAVGFLNEVEQTMDELIEIHRDHGEPLPELEFETVYADNVPVRVLTTTVIPPQRTPAGNGAAYFKDTA